MSGRAGFDEGDDDVAGEQAQVLVGHAVHVPYKGGCPAR